MAQEPISPVRIARKVREPRIEGNLAYVPLGKGKEAVIDATDVWLVEHRNWSVTVHGYARTAIESDKRPSGTAIFMHRFLIGAPKGTYVDHIDGDKLNNTRANLRLCTMAENQANRSAQSNNKTGYKGVSFCKKTGRYRAQLVNESRIYRIGRFDTAEEAARAYDAVAKQTAGEFARLNFG
jgi:hypothetical protein